MRTLVSKRLCGAFFRGAKSPSAQPLPRTLATFAQSHPRPLASVPDDRTISSRGVLGSPWSSIQRRGAKIFGSDVRLGNVIQRKGRIFQILKVQHTTQGRGGAIMQVELRDINSGNKTNERLRTDESIETVFVEEKTYSYLYTDGNTVILMEPDTYDQIEVSKDLFGKGAAYLKEDMPISVHVYDGRAVSASVPLRVTCTVAEAEGLTTAPQSGNIRHKKVLLDNGLTVQVPPFVVTGDEVVINTMDDSYITRAK